MSGSAILGETNKLDKDFPDTHLMLWELAESEPIKRFYIFVEDRETFLTME